MIKDWILKKLNAVRIEEVDKEILKQEKVFQHNIHFPEYRDKHGVLHLHSCPRGNWKESEQCVENEKGDIRGRTQWLKDQKAISTSNAVNIAEVAPR